ncbi:hypothetical protein CJF31_00002432 [Rutstroemia sp. NJR-2017a BVV2]|nr:hypothetical protein CJF31_00002432 [Rutstroemia sp. NJR-2017a BVV2]
MSRSKHAVELCSLLVDDIYGELSSRIFTILLRRGRLPMRALMRHTHLTARQLKMGLAVLIQQNLVYHDSDQEEADTQYEANADAAYNLVKSGKVLEIVEDRYGATATVLIEQLLLLGHAKVSDIIENAELDHKPHANGNGAPNGNANGNSAHAHSAGQLNAMLINLLEDELIQPVSRNMFKSPTDTYNVIERELLRDIYGGATRGTKQKDELKSKIRDRLQELRVQVPNWRPVGYNQPSKNTHLNGSAPKRRRLSQNGVATNGADEGPKLDPNLILRINFEKCAVVLRNRRLVELVNSRIGETTSYIYAELLRLLEDQTPRCKLDHRIDDTADLPDGPSITTQELADALSTSINVSTGIGKASAQRIDTSKVDRVQNGRKRKAADEAEVEGEASSDEESEEDAKPAVNGKGHAMEIDEDSDDPFAEPSAKSAKKRAVTFQDQLSKPAPTESRENRMMHVMNHLQLLAADDCHLLRKCGNRGLGEWTVDYDRVIERLRELELDAIIYENFGKTGHRLTRIMQKMGKLEEKQLSVLGLIKQKDVRTKLVEMQMAGFVDIQEVPRDAGRTISRTVFLWFFDQDRVSAILLDRIYKTMSRCLQRLDIEKRRKANIVALAERTDVQEQGEDILRPEQLNQLQEIRAKEEDLLGQIGRLDDLAGVFHDY